MPATSASLRPSQLSLDAAGNLFIADVGGSRIRRVDAATGIITTVAGGGASGDGAPATSALLTNPCGVKVDGAGNLVITESCMMAAGGAGGGSSSFSRIRRVLAATGLISTLAGGNGTSGYSGDGGPAANAMLSVPGEVTVDAAGNIFFADSNNHRVRRIDAVTQVITTVAGVGFPGLFGDGGPAASAMLNGPASVAVDGAGNLFITDLLNARIRKIDAATGIISTVAGNGVVGFNSDGILAVAASLNTPQSIAVDPLGNVFFSDTGNFRVRRIDAATGLISTVAGGGGATNDGVPANTAFLNRPGGITLSADGSKLYVSEWSANRVRMVTLPTGLATTATLVVTPAEATLGQTTTFTTTVTPATATGTVTLSASGTSFGTAPLVNGVAIYSTTLQLGQFAVNAQYSGGPGYQASTSAPVNVSVRYPATVDLASSLNPSTPLQAVTFTANVTANGGDVQFYDGASLLATVPVSFGLATFTTSSLTAGSHAMTARYSGSTNYASATSGVLTQIVKSNSTLALAASAQTIVAQQPVTFTATATPASATGSVDFLDGATVVGSGSLVSGVATLTISSLTAGSHTITARYNGDTALNPSTSPVVPLTVQAASTVTLSASANPVQPANPVTLTATVTPADATGTVQFFDGGALVGTSPVSGGVATLTLSNLSQSVHSLTAQYSGDAQTGGSTATALSLTVLTATTVDVPVPTNPAPSLGQSVTFTAFISPNGTTGTVQFFDNGTLIGSGPVAGNAGQFTTSALTLGAHSITASYGGDSRFAASAVSPALSLSVKTNATFAIASSANPSTAGQSVTFTATLPAGATGTIQFLDNGAALGSALTLAGGAATFTTSALAAGNHLISYTYAGDASYYAGASGALTQVVKAASTLALASSANPSNPGQNVTFTATVTPATATGSIIFQVNGAGVGSAPISGGVATYSSATLTSGAQVIAAQYSGDSSVAASNSAPLSQVVKTATTAAVVSNLNPSVSGQAVTFTASVTPAAATGTVQFLDNGAVIGTAALASGVATFTTSALPVSTHSIAASYAGSGTHVGSVSAAIAQTVNKVASATAVASSSNPSATGQAVTFTIAVTPATATGTVQLKDGAATLATLTLTGGVATFTTSSLTAGSHQVQAIYAGDAATNASTSAVVTQTVRTATTLTLSSSRNPARTTQSVRFTARVSPTASGTVQFFDGTTLLGTATVSSGNATLTRTGMSVAVHPIMAVYSGSTTHAPSTSPVLNQTITN